VRQVCLGHDHEPGGIPVQTVYDSGATLGPAGQSRAPSHQSID
jgi:hypothetical protein